jgi:hypothetical protein
MKKFIFICSVIVLFVFPGMTAFAEDSVPEYQYVIGTTLSIEAFQNTATAYFNGNPFVFSKNAAFKNYQAEGEVYFQPVKLDKYPYEVSPILERIGSVTFGVGYGSRSDDVALKANSDLYHIILDLSCPNSPVAADLSYYYSNTKYDSSPSLPLAYKTGLVREYDADVKYYILDNFIAGLRYDYISYNTDYQSFGNDYPYISYKAIDQLYGMFVNYFYTINNGQMIEADFSLSERHRSVTDSSDYNNNEENIWIKYYPVKQFSIELGFNNSSGDIDNTKGQTYSFASRWYVTPKTSIGLELDGYHSSYSSNNNSELYLLQLLTRF